ncbi:MAG: sugar ABC transporter ATP-binding protein, partial [Spirochaetales bacterium]|nr:sugar ABC transporter ATP-binding protein [Spirochaetales bacterium]
FKRPAEAIKFGLAMVPEDRKTLSLFMQNSISFNMSIAELPRLKRFIMIDYKKVDKIISEFIIKLKIKLGSSDHPVSSLSGGNQQKTILARWLATNPDILILDEPTHGVDVGAKSEIYQLIHQLADSGISIILISSELPEILTMSDRVVVMHEGKVTGILEKDELTEENIMAHATASVIINQEGVII